MASPDASMGPVAGLLGFARQAVRGPAFVLIATIVVVSVAGYLLLEAPMINLGVKSAARLEVRPFFGTRGRPLA